MEKGKRVMSKPKDVTVSVNYGGNSHYYPGAHGWYAASEDGTLQVFMKVDGDDEFAVAEYAKDQWEWVRFTEPPEPDPEQPEEEGQSK
jgi:hypothetical protein